MPDFRAIPRPALISKTPLISPAISLRALPEGYIIQVLGDPQQEQPPKLLSRVVKAEALDLRAASPGQWFLVGDAPLSPDDLSQLFEQLRPNTAVDQSHGRVRILVEGPMVERVLSKGTAVDLSLAAFDVGQSATTLIGHIAAHITRVAAEGFEIMVLRGFAESLWDDLARMSVEFT